MKFIKIYRYLLLIMAITCFTLLLIFKKISYGSIPINTDDDIYNSLSYLGYTSEDIDIIRIKLNENQIIAIINNRYDKDIIKYINEVNFRFKNLDRYISYQKKNNIFTISKIVTQVNIGLDNDFYTNVWEINEEEAKRVDVLVNKYNRLNDKYVPDDLVLIDTSYGSKKQYLRLEAYNNYKKMVGEAKKNNIYFYIGSAYRSYAYQDWLYNKYALETTIDIADKFSARAGYSEHQTGLAIDILNKDWKLLNHYDIEYQWLINNSYKYGFILRYPRGKEHITGYMFEDWHFRYLGVGLATKIHDSHLVYDEYAAIKEY